MSFDFSGRVAVVTGGGRDIGRAICVKLAAGGASVVVNYLRSARAAEETAGLAEEAGGRAVAVRADVTRADGVRELVETTLRAFGREIHILVNNAGGLVGRKKLPELEEHFWDEVMDVNLKSTYLVMRAVLEHMPSGGAIVNMASLAARNGGGEGAIAYATAKGGIVTFTRGLSKELGPRNIRVNAVCPGLIATTFHDTFTPDRVREQVAGGTPLRREGRAEEVGDAVAYLASDHASFITGESVEINGGLYFV